MYSLSQSDSHLKDDASYQIFSHQYLSLLNNILVELIKYRGHYAIIRRTDPSAGLCSHVISNLGQIIASLKEGLIPIIDTENSQNLFSNISKESEQNAWEIFFKQLF